MGPLWKMHKNSAANASKFAVLKKYGLISLSQTAISMIYGISLIVRFCASWYHTDGIEGISYLDLCTVIQSLDIMVTLACVYIGFVKKETDKSYCSLCKDHCLFFETHENPERNGQYTVLWDEGLVNRPNGINNGDDEDNKTDVADDNVFIRRSHETISYEDTGTTESITRLNDMRRHKSKSSTLV